MVWLILISPLVGAFCSGFLGRFLGRKGSIFITISCMLISVICSFILFYTIGINDNLLYFKFGTWLSSEDFIIYWGFLVDSLTVTMLLVVTIISTLVHLFSSEYLFEDSHLSRFMAYLSLFTFFMLILITSGNFIQLFLGWEGVGICSYLLINFWYNRVAANKAAIKALVVNKVGDLSLLFGIVLIFIYTKTVDFHLVFNLVDKLAYERFLFLGYTYSPITVASFFLVVGAVGKSAQIGLHTWLPDAMEGPTPVSALIHAATMVTAGVFLLIRVSPILEKANPAILTTIALLGSVTALIFALAGMFQYDLKKIIAYSTCSQLGYMFFICGTSNYLLGIFHIFTHAGFKALLFLTAGALIHSLKDEQDIRKMGGLINFYPFYALLFIISSLSLSGFPFLSGFYSKDLILELVSTSFLLKGSFSSVLGQIAAFASAYYSIRFIYFVFFNSYRGSILFKEGLHNPSLKYLFILGFLCIISIFGGFLFFDFFYGNASEFYKGSFVINKTIVFENEALPFVVKQLPLIFSILGILVFFSNSNSIWNNISLFTLKSNLKKLLIMRGGFDYFYNNYLSSFILSISYFYTFKLIDKIFLEFLGPKGITLAIHNTAYRVMQLQTGYLKHYWISFFWLLNFILPH